MSIALTICATKLCEGVWQMGQINKWVKSAVDFCVLPPGFCAGNLGSFYPFHGGLVYLFISTRADCQYEDNNFTVQYLVNHAVVANAQFAEIG